MATPTGWNASGLLDAIQFYGAPGPGLNNITVQEFSGGAFAGSTSIWAFGAWSAHFGYPAEVEYFGDRMFFARTRSQPQTIWGSRVAAYSDFGKSSPIQDDDSLVFTLNARQVNEIRDLVPLDSMLCMTSGGEWVVTGGSDGVLTPSSVGFRPQSYRGVNTAQGVIVGNSALFIQDRGSVVRDIAWKFDSDGYDGVDLSIFAAHLCEGFSLVSMAFQQSPNSVVWIVRSDGVLLGLTYVREQEVVGWHWHDTDGFIENVCCVPEAGGDALYICVRRVVDGNTRRMIERLESRDVFNQVDCFFVDSGLTYDGRNKGVTTVKVSGGVTWGESDQLTIVSSVPVFTFSTGTGDSAWVGDQVMIGTTRFSVSDWVSTSEVKAFVIGQVPAEIRNVATTDFTLMRGSLRGLDHLEGKTVAVLSDGNEEARKVVLAGGVTLDRPGGVVHIGLPYVSDFETLEVNSIGSETIRDRKKIIPSVSVIVDKSAGIFAGPDFDHLEMHRPRELEDYDAPTPLLTGVASIDMTTRWDDSGRICIRQSSPLPLTILGIIPELKVGG